MYWLIVALAATKLIPAGVGLYRYAHLKLSLRIFTVLIILGAINEALLFVLAKRVGNNLYMLHVFAVIEVSLVSAFLWLELKNGKFRKGMALVTCAVIVFSIGYAMYGNNLFQYPSEPRVLDATLIIACCIFLFYEMATTGDGRDPLRDSAFFINGGVMLYFTATFITWMMMKYVVSDSGFVYALYGSHAYINAFCNLVFAYGLWISSPLLSYRS